MWSAPSVTPTQLGWIRCRPNDVLQAAVRSVQPFLAGTPSQTQLFQFNIGIVEQSTGLPSTITINLNNGATARAAVVKRGTINIDGWICNAAVEGLDQNGNNAWGPGQVYVQLALYRAGSRMSELFAGYYYDGHNISFPQDPLEPMVDWQRGGAIRELTIVQPAANAEIAAQAVPTKAVWKPKALSITMVQGATQTPRPSLRLRDGSANILSEIDIGATIGANTTVNLTWQEGLETGGNNVNNGSLFAPMPNVGYMQATWDLITNTIGIGANSRYNAGKLVVEEFILDLATQT